jgi:hypothetical protein
VRGSPSAAAAVAARASRRAAASACASTEIRTASSLARHVMSSSPIHAHQTLNFVKFSLLHLLRNF